MSLDPCTRRPARALIAGLGLALALAIPASDAHAQDDTVLFATTQVAPNVIVLMDNSGSMNHITWHPDFDPTATYTCNETDFPGGPSAGGAYDPTRDYFITSTGPFTRCGVTRTLFIDAKRDDTMRYDGRYLNWLFSPEADAAYAEISQTNNGFPSSCVGGNSFPKYQRTRMNVAKQVLKDVVCQVNLVGQVRFGIATFRKPGTANDPNGGFVLEPVEVPTSNQQADLVSAIQSLSADTWTPLAESLFQIYTYYMSRTVTDIPFGADGVTKFPVYSYNTSTSGVGGTFTTNSNSIPPDPVQYSCQKNFVIIVTDGEPTKDDFDEEDPIDTARGFTSFGNLIGDVNPDGEVEVPGGCSECSLYLDDVAMYMQNNDFRPDFADDQTLDVYAVGFSTDPAANGLLQKTAQVGNGLFFGTNDEDELAQAIIDALTDIIEKSQSFTAATVPASRTAAGDHLYVSLFTPSDKTPYWSGHLRSYRITAAGEIQDSMGQCALDDPNAGECFSGPFLPTDQRPPFWDAADEIPSPTGRALMASVTGRADPAVRFLHTQDGGLLTPADLGITTFPPTVPYTGSTATTSDELAAEIVANVRGCKFGTGANGVACVERPTLLSDIFHSNPVVVGKPALFDPDPTYKTFANNHATRYRMIYAGSNGGFLHGFLAGVWQSTATPPQYDSGTGEELFAFMPWPARQNIKELPRDTGTRDHYFVDGSPTVADVWIPGNRTQAGKTASSEWRTALVGGLRQGGEAYYALDVTDPALCDSAVADSGWPCYMWEFPTENDAATFADGTLYSDYLGETWGDPIITKIRVKVGSNNNVGAGFERWVAIVTGGYDPSGDPNQHQAYDPTSTKGRSIWILDVATGRPLAVKRMPATANCPDPTLPSTWVGPNPGETDYRPANPEASLCYAFATTPAVYDVDGDGFADTIMAGDVGGQLWKWVIRDIGDDRIADGTNAIESQPNWTFRKIFQAPVYIEGGGNNAVGFYKSFFFPPAATLKSGKLWLALGTGERSDLLFMGDTGTQADNNRFYAIRHLDPFDLQVTLTDLQSDPDKGVLREVPFDTSDNGLLDVTGDETCADVAAYDGYYFVGTEGEKWVTNVDIFSYIVLASSYIPTPSTDPCEIGGESFLYSFRIYCGEGFFTDGAGNPERSFDIGSGLPTDPRVTIGTGDPDSNRVIINKQGGEIMNLQAPPGFGAGIGIFYWRELE